MRPRLGGDHRQIEQRLAAVNQVAHSPDAGLHVERALTDNGRQLLEAGRDDIGDDDARRVRRPMVEDLHPERERLADGHPDPPAGCAPTTRIFWTSMSADGPPMKTVVRANVELFSSAGSVHVVVTSPVFRMLVPLAASAATERRS